MRHVLRWVGDRYVGLAGILVVMILVHRGLRSSPLLANEYADGMAFGLALLLGGGLLALLVWHGRSERKK